MASLFDLINNFIYENHVDVSVAPMDFKEESAAVKIKREKAIARMKEMGRLSLREGGEFSLHNKHLKRNQQLPMF